MLRCPQDVYISHNGISRLPENSVSQHPKLTNKSVFHNVYIRPKVSEIRFPRGKKTSCGSSGCHHVGACYCPLVNTLELKGLMNFVMHHFRQILLLLENKKLYQLET